MDACINTQPYLRTEKDLDYRLYILELSMEYVEDAESITLSRGIPRDFLYSSVRH